MNKLLKWFLIQRFVIALVFIAVSQELINMLYRRFLPELLLFLRIDEIKIENEGSILLLMLQMLLYFLAGLLPKGIAGVVQNELQELMAGKWQLKITSAAYPIAGNAQWQGLYQVGVFLVFMLLFAITLLPYFLAIIWYYIQISRKVQELIEQEKEQKRQYDKARNLMLSDITHDIKTPITTICSYAKALTDGVVTLDENKQQEYLHAIYAKSMRMSELITTLFEYVKMDSEGFALHKEKADLGELLRENIALLYTDFEEKGMELEIDIPEMAFPMELDKNQMSRSISNILTNALKYNTKGTKVLIRLDEDYCICIADTGTRIEPELAAHIFEPFSRGDKARSTSGGSGLGLSIAKKIVEMHGGKMRLSTAFGDGYSKAFIMEFHYGLYDGGGV